MPWALALAAFVVGVAGALVRRRDGSAADDGLRALLSSMHEHLTPFVVVSGLLAGAALIFCAAIWIASRRRPPVQALAGAGLALVVLGALLWSIPPD